MTGDVAADAKMPIAAVRRGTVWKTALELVLLLAVLIGHAALLRAYYVPLVGGVDPNGYHVGARLLADQGRYYRVAEDPYQFIGRMWVVNERDQYYPKYPPFYPALAAGAMRLFGDEAGFRVNPAAAWLTLPALFLFVRRRAGRAAALIAVFALATNPLFNLSAVRQMSHAVSLGLLAWGMMFATAAPRARSIAAALAFAFVGGAFIGTLAGVRYTEALMVLPLFWWAATGPRGRRWLLLAASGAGLLIPWTILALFHHRAYGRAWLTGYSLTAEQTGFAWSYAADNLRFYGSELLAFGLGPVVGGLFPLGWAVAACRRRRDFVFYLLWIAPLSALYIFYYWAPEGRAAGYLRFLMPLWIPCIALAAEFAAGLRARFAELGRARWLLPAAVVATQALWGVMESVRGLEPAWLNARFEHSTIEFVRTNVPEGAVLIGPANLLNSLDFDQRWRLYADELLQRGRLQRLVSSTLQPGPSGLQKRRAEILQELLLDGPPLQYRIRIRELIEGHRREGRDVYLLAGPTEIVAFETAWRGVFGMETLAEHNPELPAWRWMAAGKPREPGTRPEPTTRRRPLSLARVVER